MNPAIQPIRAASKEMVRLTRRELETSLRRIARAGPVIAASQSLIDRTNEMLDAAARIVSAMPREARNGSPCCRRSCSTSYAPEGACQMRRMHPDGLRDVAQRETHLEPIVQDRPRTAQPDWGGGCALTRLPAGTS
jgi:hypothetical protein